MVSFATTLSGSLIPKRIARFFGSEISSVEAFGGGGGIAAGVELNALYKTLPSGANALPPTLVGVANGPVIEKGALAVLACANTLSDAISYSVKPAMKLDPSGDIESVVDWPVTVRLWSNTPDATS